MKFKCPKHPEYKALRKPTAKCGMCYILWRQAQAQQEPCDEYRPENNGNGECTRCFFREEEHGTSN